jgi:hypothetical protein
MIHLNPQINLISAGSVAQIQLPRIKIMSKQTYHQPEFRMYGNISVMTQNMGSTSTAASDGATGITIKKKTS